MSNRGLPSVEPARLSSRTRISVAVKITGIYLVVGFLWIFYSDQLLTVLLHRQADVITRLQTLKGWFYVVATAGMLWWLIHRETQINQRVTRKLKDALVELQTAQSALQKSQEQFTAFMDHSPAAAWVTDLEGHIEYVSRGYTSMFQAPLDLVGQNVFDIYPHDVAQTYVENIQLVGTTGQVLQIVEPGIRKTGEPGQFLVYKFPLPQPDGRQQVGGVAIDVTQWKQAEALLRMSEERYRNVVETTLEGVWIIDTESRTSYVNSRMAEMLGYDVDEMLNKPLSYFMDDAGWALATEKLKHRHRGVSEQHDFRFKTKGGQDLWTLLSTNPLYDDAGNYVGALAMLTDITERKQTDDQLRKQFNLLEMAQQAAQMGVFELDLMTDQAYWTVGMEEILGLKLEDRPHNLDTWFSQLHPDDQVRWMQLLQDWRESNWQPALRNNEYRFYRHGEERWIDARAYIVRDDQGNALRMIGTNLDITERKRSEAALQASEEQLRLALDFTQIGTWDWNLKTNQLVWSREHFYLLGMEPETAEASYDAWRHCVHPDDLPRLELAVKTALDCNTTYEEEYRVTHPNGTMRWLLGKGRAIYDAEGQPIRMLGGLLDITDRKQTEELLRSKEQQFRQAIVNAPYPAILHAEDGEVVQVNQVWTELTGYDISDIPTVADWLEKAYGQRMEAVRVRVDQLYARDTRVYEGEFTPRTKAGQERVWDFSSAPVGRLPDGRRLVLSMAADITERKWLERALRRQAEQVEVTSAIAQRIRQSLNLKEILNTTVVEMKQLLKVDRVIIYQFVPDWSGTVVAEAVGQGWSPSLGTEITDTCFQGGGETEYQYGKKRAIANVYKAGLTDCYLHLLEQFEVKAQLIVPILVMEAGEESSTLWGLLIAHQCSAPRDWHTEQLNLLEQIALQMAIAIQQAQTYEQAQRELVERQHAERHLRAALAEKEVLLKEIHHRVKNNLQIVSGLLQLQAQGLSDLQIVNALRESQNRIESMSLIHKKLYRSAELEQIDAPDYIQSLAVSLLTTYQISPGAVSLQVDVAPVSLNLDQAIPCGLIINELVSNALKYAFADNYSGEINIKLRQQDDQLELTIQDNGIGLPEYLCKPTINWQDVQSLGLSLVYALATEQLDGSLTIDHHQGTTFTIRFPQLLPRT